MTGFALLYEAKLAPGRQCLLEEPGHLAIAEAAGRSGIGFAVGSQRIALEGRGSAGFSRHLRTLAGPVPILANFGAALMVVSLVRGGDWWLVRGMSGKLWRALGRRSYIIYLIHFPLAMILDQIGAQHEKFQTLGGLLYVPLLIGSTEFTHRFIEKPAVRYFRNRGRATPTPTVTG